MTGPPFSLQPLSSRHPAIYFLIFELIKRWWPLSCKSMILKRFDCHFVPNHCVNPMIKKLYEGTCSQVIIFFFTDQKCWSRSQMLQWAKSKWLCILHIYFLHSRLYSTLKDSIPFSHVQTLVQLWIEEQERELQQQYNGSPPPQSPLHLCIRTWNVGMECVQEDTGVHFWQFWVGMSDVTCC